MTAKDLARHRALHGFRVVALPDDAELSPLALETPESATGADREHPTLLVAEGAVGAAPLRPRAMALQHTEVLAVALERIEARERDQLAAMRTASPYVEPVCQFVTTSAPVVPTEPPLWPANRAMRRDAANAARRGHPWPPVPAKRGGKGKARR